ncbi:MAG: hypothetical protein HN849_06235, partial [Victivallales bacterium]|nr:hypothetical protein [Victivallales bacterium]
LQTVRQAVGTGVTIAGNIDPVAIVHQGTPAGIRLAIERCYEIVGNPFMVNAGCEIPPGTPVENFRAFCQPIPYRS